MDHPTVAKHPYEQVFPVFGPSSQDSPSGSDQPTQSEEAQPAAPRKANGRSPLFWVNADVQSVKGGSREATLKRIRSHVMSEHNRKKRLENTRRYNKSKTWKNLAFRPDALVKTNDSSSTSLKSSSSSSPSSSVMSSPPGNPSSKDSTSPESTQDVPTESVSKVGNEAAVAQSLSVQAPAIESEWIPTNTHSPWSTLGASQMDPFNAAQVPVSNSHFQHLRLFLNDLVAQAAPFRNHGVPALRNHWVALVRTNPVLLHSCITMAATHKALSSGVFSADSATQRTSSLILDRLYHRGETIRLIHRDLSNSSRASSDALIAAVALMIGIETASEHPDWILIHLNGLRKIVSLRKNFSDISKDVRWQIEWTDIRAACKSMSKPIFPFIRYTLPEHTPAVVLPENAGLLASNLRALGQVPGVFGIDIRRAIDDLTSVTLYCEIYKRQQRHHTHPPEPLLLDAELEEYFNNEVLYIEHSLCNDRFTDGNMPRSDDHTIQGIVRLAMLLFHNTVLWGFYPLVAPIFLQPILTLEAALRAGTAADNFQHAPEIVAWTSFIGYCASRIVPASREFFLHTLVAAIHSARKSSSSTSAQRRIESFDAFHVLLQGYFYVDRCYLAEAQDVWQHIH
ncbi:hypothetical protein PISL3812_07054 [Talaromyces islandicus]|uniref:Uncharacterized protein n=1 Tax=Talaromyces islandicus TaxID=28573 RepID=A0A0U1M334_TALIS|nr:hypothetical protein PISL3812_07054 [Talaromyces islandicus]